MSMAKQHTWHDRVVWITGGGSGIGQALAEEVARHGAHVVVSGRRLERLEDVVQRIESAGGRGRPLVCDVTDEAQIASAVAQIVQTCGRLDVVVANAGFSVAGRLEKLTADDWRRQLDTNVVGLAVTAKHAIPELKKSRGRLALIGSVAGMVCAPGVGAYHASKHAVRAIGQTLAMELHGTGISVTTIHPGFVESEIAQVDNSGVFRPEVRDRRPQRLMWSAEDAARVMARAIDRRKREYVFTYHGKLAGWLGRHAPGLVHQIITRARIEYKRAPRSETKAAHTSTSNT